MSSSTDDCGDGEMKEMLIIIRGRLKCCHDSLLQATVAAAALLAIHVKLIQPTQTRTILCM